MGPGHDEPKAAFQRIGFDNMRFAPGLARVAALAICLLVGCEEEQQPTTNKYSDAKAERRVQNYLLSQSKLGGWPRGVDLGHKAYTERERDIFRRRYSLRAKPGSRQEDTNVDATLLERTTTDKIRELAALYVALGEQDADLAGGVERGVAYLLRAENRTGCFPAFYPEPSFTRRWHENVLLTEDVTFATVELLEDVAAGREPFQWMDQYFRKVAGDAVARFRTALVKMQVKVRGDRVLPVIATEGERTGWSDRHHRKTLSPAWGRDFQPRSLSPTATRLAVRWLMKRDDPTESEKEAIRAAVAWLHGRQTRPATREDGPRDHWATCVELVTNRPIFGDYVGYAGDQFELVDHVFYRWEDLSEESRKEQVWFVPVDTELFTTDYPAWRAKHDPEVDVLADTDADGLLDRWEAIYGLDPTDASDGTADSDADGISNLDEYYADTHPTISIQAPESRFFPNTQVTITTIGGDTAEVFYSVDGSPPGRQTRRYRKPIRINDTLAFRATAFVGEKQLPVEEAQFELVRRMHHLPLDGSHPSSPIADMVMMQQAHFASSERQELEWVPGAVGNALQLNGREGYISFTSELLDSHEGAVALWVRLDRRDGKRYIFNAFRLPRNRIELYSSSGKLAVRFGELDPAYLGEKLDSNVWTHLVLNWNRGDFEVYRDGELAHRGKYKDFQAKGALIALGGYFKDKTQTFSGSLDDVHIYNRAVTADEVRKLYERAQAAGDGRPQRRAARQNY
ncbi:MAG: hypothetical protein DWQ31_03040 [Planctomycetota bacterium]|nr:MAG: hypothetical protein DWQ31_03040 [Planctomycetota bacterium]REJ96567.1 MAG: hypothetical protein DWQ35_04265 [Planctomycetota bacterium]